MSQRLSRKEIKRDEVLEGAARVTHWIQDNLQPLLLGLGVIVLLAVGGAVFANYRAGKNATANSALSEAMAVGDGGSRQALEEVASKYAGTPAGRLARAVAGTEAGNAGDAESAREEWTAALDTTSDDALAAAVAMNLVSLDRAEGRLESAVERLQGMADGSGPLPQDLALLELGRTLEELGRMDEAREAFQELVDEHPTSAVSARARTKLRELETG